MKQTITFMLICLMAVCHGQEKKNVFSARVGYSTSKYIGIAGQYDYRISKLVLVGGGVEADFMADRPVAIPVYADLKVGKALYGVGRLGWNFGGSKSDNLSTINYSGTLLDLGIGYRFKISNQYFFSEVNARAQSVGRVNKSNNSSYNEIYSGVLISLGIQF